MKALSDVRLPIPDGSSNEKRRETDANQLLLNKNFRQLQDAVRDLEERIKVLEARCS